MTLPAPADSPTRARVSAAEWQARVDLAAAYRLVAHFNWDDLIFTHISARVPGTHDHFLINPFGLLFAEITASSLVKVNLDGTIAAETEYSINPTGFTIHSAIHHGRPEVDCIMHLHTIAGTAVACQEQGLLLLSQMAIGVGEVAYHDYEGLALNHDERPRLLASLGDRHSLILRNHGTLTVGGSIAEAFLRMYRLERACAMQVAALAGGQALRYPSAAATALAKQQAVGSSARGAVLVWPALLRMLDAKDPSYKT